MTPGMQALAVYSAQIALIVAAATAVAWLVRLRVPVVRLWLWRATGLLCLALPFARIVPAPPPITVTFGRVDTVITSARALPSAEWLGPLVAAVLLAGRSVADAAPGSWLRAAATPAPRQQPGTTGRERRGPARRRGAARGAALDEPSRPAGGVRPAPPAGPFAPKPRHACPSKLARRCSVTSCCTWRGTIGRGSSPRT